MFPHVLSQVHRAIRHGSNVRREDALSSLSQTVQGPTWRIQGPQNNFFIQQLLDSSSGKYGSSDDTMKCEICSKREATKFCVDCSQDMCDSCLEPHSKLRSSQSHKVITQTEKTFSAVYTRACLSYCEKHTDKPLELYCNDCQLVICIKCFALDHKTHFTSDLQETSSTFASKLKDVFPRLDRCIGLNKTELSGS